MSCCAVARQTSVGIGEMTSKPVVVLALSRSVAGQMFSCEDLERLGAVAQVLGPFDSLSLAQDRPLQEAVIAVTGWGSPAFDAELLAQAPKLKLVVHSAGSVKPIATE